MRLRKQAPAKALIVAAIAGLFFAFFSLIKSEPRIDAEAEPLPPVDYNRFFAPNASAADAAPAPSPPVHTRTRPS
jgi:hypothetical protein